MSGYRGSWRVLLLATLAMGYGWGWRGDYGHELGAMVPGALVAMAVCLAAGRPDWWERCLVWGLFGAVGWAFGGSQSYGMVLGYTLHARFWGVAYGFACIFLIGAVWGAIGGGFLGIAMTEPRKRLNAFLGPFVAIFVAWAALKLAGGTAWSEEWPPLVEYDVDWLAAVSALVVATLYWAIRRNEAARLLAVLALGWCLGFGILTWLFGLRMTPPRSDNWSGILGMAVAFWAYLSLRHERGPRLVMAYGCLFGGLGFSVGALFLSIESVHHWPIGGWRIMEHFFGLVMGFGIALAALRLRAGDVAPAQEDAPSRGLDYLAVLVLFPLVLGLNGQNNVNEWLDYAQQEAKMGQALTISEGYLGLTPHAYYIGLVLLGTVVLIWMLARNWRNRLPFVSERALGRGQLVFLVFLWMAVAVDFALKGPRMAHSSVFLGQVVFILSALVCTWLMQGAPSVGDVPERAVGARDARWRAGRAYWVLWAAVPVVLLLLTLGAMAVHPQGLPNAQYRFSGPQIDPNPAK